MKILRNVKGMHDTLPADMPKWHFVEATYRELVERYGFEEIRTPILEPIELFVRGIGEVTDIVEKEMYAFEDKGGAHVALRPECTASVIRSYIQHNTGAKEPISKQYYIGPMFRRERPAKGRYRQFYQAGAELIGVSDPAADAEIIEMAVQFVRALGLKDVMVQINSLGDATTRPRYREALVTYFEEHVDDLCGDCKRRLERNPLRVLDCKAPGCQQIASEAPGVLSYLSPEAEEHFETVQAMLDSSETPYEVVPSMVRGLDYYTRTIFEIQGTSEHLGAQSAIVGGGRYDGLVEQLGGKPTPAIGFSFGIERVIMALGNSLMIPSRPLVYVVGVGNGGFDRARRLTRMLRTDGFTAEAAYAEASMRAQLKKADRYKARIVLIAGDDEAAREAVTLRNMEDGAQQEVPLAALKQRIAEAIS